MQPDAIKLQASAIKLQASAIKLQASAIALQASAIKLQPDVIKLQPDAIAKLADDASLRKLSAIAPLQQRLSLRLAIAYWRDTTHKAKLSEARSPIRNFHLHKSEFILAN